MKGKNTVITGFRTNLNILRIVRTLPLFVSFVVSKNSAFFTRKKGRLVFNPVER